MEIYNSLTRRIEPLDVESPVGLYVCGITPYDATHLGHAFTYTAFDVLIRLLQFQGHEVTYVQNITDIDDDILKRAGQVGMDWKELGDREVKKFLKDCDALNNLRPAVMPKATEFIPDMIEIIEKLIDRDVAYERDGNVYFDLSKDEAFGTRLFTPEEGDVLTIANQRGNFPDDPLKKNPLDFVLWQAKKPGEPFWASPWGDGRPGWHIECTALGKHYLGAPFAIHGGGNDLLFPHHECEIVQTKYSEDTLPAHYWMHVGMLRYEGEKMSKSLGNMVFVSDLLQTYASDAIRYVLLKHHYRDAWEYFAPYIDEAQEEARLLASQLKDVPAATREATVDSGKAFLAHMASDLNTPAALQELSKLATSESDADRSAARTLATEVLGFRLNA